MDAVKNSSSKILTDNFGRNIDYLRIAVTDRCNLRCIYCMPEEGIPYISHNSLLTFEENLRLVKIFTSLGITKLRLTGGEPFVRRGFAEFLQDISQIESHPGIYITSNGVLAGRYVQELTDLKIKGFNLSLDTLDKDKFYKISRRDEFESVKNTIDNLLESKINLKINCVVQNGVNDDEIISIANLAKDNDIEVRFIEEMPFNGYREVDHRFTGRMIYNKLLESLSINESLNCNSSTAKLFNVDGFKGRVGIIGGYSRSFCSSCNRIRITSTGMLKTCLYDNGVLDLRLLLRSGTSDNDIIKDVYSKIKNRFENGFKAERYYKKINNSSMASIGG